MHIEIINTGSELLLGRVLNTHQQWLCRHLADHGYLVNRQVAITDSGRAIQDAVKESLSACFAGSGACITAPRSVFHSERRLRRRTPLLGEVREGAVHAPSR